MEVTILNKDGLGNRYFKLAFLYSYCKRNGYKPVVFSSLSDPDPKMNSILNGFWTQIQKKNTTNEKFVKIEELLTEPCVYKKYEKLPELQGIPVFTGFYQSEKYFKEYSKDIKKFIWDDRPLDFLLKKYPEITNSYFIHVRGGDFLTLKHAIPNIDNYYKKCISMIGNKKFVIFTNDKEYCSLLGLNYQVIEENEINSLYLMSKCLGGVCANSTFSWWGAWLNERQDKEIYMPKEWFVGEKFKGFKWDDIYFDSVNIVSVENENGETLPKKEEKKEIIETPVPTPIPVPTPTPKLTIITPTIGNEEYLLRNIKSVQAQSNKEFKHLIVVDGQQFEKKVRDIVSKIETNTIETLILVLPENTGANGWICHRIYGGIPYLVNTEYTSFLDEDNFLEPNHVETILKTMNNQAFCFTHRNIVDKNGKFICRDECESMGSVRPVWNVPNLNFVDTNCFTFRTEVSVQLSMHWYSKARQPGKEDADRVVSRILFSQNNLPNKSTNEYTINYMVENREDSVKKEYFLAGNDFIRQNIKK